MRTMFVRYLGTKVCWTVDDGRFYIGEREELNDAEKAVCEAGGGDMPLSFGVNIVAR